MRGKYQVVLLALLAFGLLIAPLTARAGTNDGTDMVLQLCSGGSCSTTFNDAGSGFLAFNTSIGQWNINAGNALGSDGSSGIGLPNLMDLSSLDATTSGGGTGLNALTLQLSMKGLTAQQVVSVLNAIGGTNNSTGLVTVTTQAFLSTAAGGTQTFCNTGVSGCTALTSLLSLSTTGQGQEFAGHNSGILSGVGATYSLTLDVTISSANADNSSFDDNLTMVPEPATLSVLGAGLLALGTGLRKKLSRG
jgi:hypothetical protein